MSKAVIVEAVRTPIGRAHPARGYYRDTRSDDLAAACLRGLLDRAGLDANLVEDVLLGCTQQTMEQGMNLARNVLLMSGIPVESGGATINRLCGSSLQALNQAAHSIVAGAEDVQIVGGVEHMHHLPMTHGLDINPKLLRHTSRGALHMGVTAEFLAQSMDVSREAQDQFALASHQKAAAAHAAGKFNAEIVPMQARDEQGQLITAEVDQCVRADTSLEALGALEPAFMPRGGTVTAGNSSPLNDGAAAMLVMSEDRANELGLKPIARVRATAVAGVDPCVMGTGPIPATKKALARAGLTVNDVDLFELNEAFAVQALVCMRGLKLDPAKVNVHGGAVAIGHPLGASGARIATTLLHAMRDRDATLGVATMCIGVGQGIATVFERIS
ncbi:MAG: acetyl-CoA C-acyltransferase FadA [Planctomycetales bacterium]|nr:acetyl-CoA C-acyltransferase FadA [Planctomycetales bacterium]